MQRLMALEEQHRQTVKAKELEMVRIKEELEKKWNLERKEVEEQRQEVEKLQEEIEAKRTELEVAEQQARAYSEHRGGVSPSSSRTPVHGGSREDMQKAPAEEDLGEGAERRSGDRSHIEVLRERLNKLEADYEDQRKIAQREIGQAKEAVRKVEQVWNR